MTRESIIQAIEALQAMLAVMQPTRPAVYVEPEAEPTHTDDYRIVRHGKNCWTLSPLQRTAVRLLWECWQRGKPEVDGGAIIRFVAARADHAIENVETETDLFEFLNWSSLVVRANYGVYRLAFSVANDERVAA